MKEVSLKEKLFSHRRGTEGMRINISIIVANEKIGTNKH